MCQPGPLIAKGTINLPRKPLPSSQPGKATQGRWREEPEPPPGVSFPVPGRNRESCWARSPPACAQVFPSLGASCCPAEIPNTGFSNWVGCLGFPARPLFPASQISVDFSNYNSVFAASRPSLQTVVGGRCQIQVTPPGISGLLGWDKRRRGMMGDKTRGAQEPSLHLDEIHL